MCEFLKIRLILCFVLYFNLFVELLLYINQRSYFFAKLFLKSMLQHGRLTREISRPDFKEKVYQKLMKMITLNTDKLDGIEIKSK